MKVYALKNKNLNITIATFREKANAERHLEKTIEKFPHAKEILKIEVWNVSTW